MNGMAVVEKLAELARKYHEGQTRDDKTTPYISHPEAVVARLRGWGVNEENGEDDIITLAVAWGHDLFEDTEIDQREVEGLRPYGWKIAEGIRMLTFHEPNDGWDRVLHGYKAEAKEMYIAGVAAKADPRILIVKIADRLCNAMERVKTDDRKAMAYIEMGLPLLENVHRLPEHFAATVEADFRRCYAEIKKCHDVEEFWERMSGGAGYPEE